jgi:hypothetical protein
MNKYAFALSQFNGKEIVSNIEKFLGITKKKKRTIEPLFKNSISTL